MDELVDLLERTTPSVAAPNVRVLTRRARARRGRRWAAVTVPLVVLAAGAVAVTPTIGRHVTAAGQPDPVGAWRRATTPPIDVTSQVRTVTLPDGRVLVVSGSFDVDMPVHRFEAAVYDANADSWTRLPNAPVSPAAGGADLLAANNRFLLVTHDDAGNVSLALLDGSSFEWRPVPIPSEMGHVFTAWAWNGTTLALARFGYSPYGDRSGPAAVERWNADTGTWRQGATPPVSARFQSTVARTPHQLSVWGGETFDQHAPGSAPRVLPVPKGDPTPPTTAVLVQPTRVLTDGAVYDLDRDTWSYIAPDASLVDMANRSPFSLLTPTTFTLMSSSVEGSPRIVDRYEHGHWRQLPSPSAAGGGFVDQDSATIAISDARESGPQHAQYIEGTTDAWRPAPAYELARGPRGLVATSATMDGPLGKAFSVWRLDADAWTPAVPAPFSNRMEPGIGLTGDRVLVIGGQEGPNLDPKQDAWVLDFTAG